MFTGIIEETGRVLRSGRRLRVECTAVLRDAVAGSSIAVNGCCLTAVQLDGSAFEADLSPETLARTSLGDLSPGSLVNLERPVLAGGRLDGHIVQGHVDGTGEYIALDPLPDDNWWVRVRIPEELERYAILKGSVALDGISLTIAALESGIVSVAVIPHTWAHTNLHTRRPRDRVNVESDLIAKYVEKLVSRGSVIR